jgi:hypothetical protein
VEQDPCDFPNHFLNRLPESLLSIFKGRKRYTIDGVSDSTDEFFSVGFGSSLKIEDTFYHFAREEDDGNMPLYTPIDKIPSVLVVRLKRFEYDILNETQRMVAD